MMDEDKIQRLIGQPNREAMPPPGTDHIATDWIMEIGGIGDSENP
jgi:hypothetical protein